MKRIYEAPAYDRQFPDSYWRASANQLVPFPALEGHEKADVVIIGAGFTGLNAALELVESHCADVVVLDRSQPGWGASGRNGGFACMGGARLSDLSIAKRYGRADAREWVQAQRGAIDMVAGNLERYGIDADRHSQGEICLAHGPRAWAAMKQEVAAANDALGETCRLIEGGELAQNGLSIVGAAGASVNPQGFALHPMRYVLGLTRAAQGKGVRIFGNSEATAITQAPDGGWIVKTKAGQVQAPRVILATNGYGADALPPGLGPVILPVLSAILMTSPLSYDEQRAQGWTSDDMAFDSRTLLHYFRKLPDGRFLFGMRGGLFASARGQARVFAGARAHFRRFFPAWKEVEITHQWSGLACLTANQLPFVGAIPGAFGLFAGYGYHGNGVAMGSQTGRWLGTLAAGGGDPRPSLLRRPPQRFPLPRLRRLALGAGYLGAMAGDALG